MELHQLSAAELAKNTKQRSVSKRSCSIVWMKSGKDDEIGAFITVDEEGALKRAEEVQAKTMPAN